MSRRLERDVEAIVADRIGRECILMPSGRLALYCALRTFLAPGDALLMSPDTDDVILFIVLAAGLRPVAAPICPDDGNIDIEAIPPETWTQVDGLLTTNLYGLPDRMAVLRERCAAHGMPLIEDVAHAIETEVDGQPLGTFGAAAAFSLSKHVDAYRGGVLAVADATLRSELERWRDHFVIGRNTLRRAADVVKPPLRVLLGVLGVAKAVRGAREAAAQWQPERGTGHRMDLRADELRRAIAAAPALDPFEPWVRVDRHDYRMRYTGADLDRMLERLRGLPADRERRIEGVERLRKELALVAPGARRGPALPLFRVPLLVADREAVRAELARRRAWIHYIYDPPLDDYAGPEFVTPSPAPAAARWWARHALPIDPLKADVVIPTLRTVSGAPRFA
jgi:dTDP-4-amino-4,6-dideoxygalactose transaminase